MMNIFKKPFRSGFTLLELLIVISIIGILVAAGTAAFMTAQKKGRDARRVSDLKAIQNAQEQALASTSAYEVICNSNELDSGATSGVLDILAPLPTDPKNDATYKYLCLEDNSENQYCVSAALESNKGNCGGCSAAGEMITTADTHYCVVNLQ